MLLKVFLLPLLFLLIPPFHISPFSAHTVKHSVHTLAGLRCVFGKYMKYQCYAHYWGWGVAFGTLVST